MIRLLDGELSERKRVRLETHLLDCERCRAEIEEVKALRRQWAEFPRLASHPEDRALIRGLAAAVPSPRAPGPVWADWVTAAAFSLSLVVAIHLYHERRMRPEGARTLERASYEVLTPAEWTARTTAVPLVEESRAMDLSIDSRGHPSGK
jgi:anti-sigma factor RsiW